MDIFPKIKNEISRNLTNFENELWKSLTQATNDQDSKKVDTINSIIKKKKYVESEILNLFSQLSLKEETNKNLPPVSKSGILDGNRAKSPKLIPQLICIGDDVQKIRYLNEIPIAIANWILNKGGTIPENRNFIHRNDQGFSKSANIKRLQNGWYIEIGDDKQTLMMKGRKLLDMTGFGSTSFRVEILNGDDLKG